MDTLERCCRLCAQEQETTIMIFGTEAASMQLQHKLKQYFLIEIEEDDKLPKNICIHCCMQLQNVCDFIESTRHAQEILLRKIMNIGSHNEDINITTTPEITTTSKIKPNILPNDRKVEVNTEITYLNGADGENVTLTRLTHTTSNDENDTNKLKQFPCKFCHRQFRSDIALKNHMWSHSGHGESGKPYTCLICEIAFDFKNDFLAHNVKEHNNTRKCAMCNRAFRSERNLNAHMAIHFSKKSLYTCNECGRSYATRSSFTNHSISHSNERPHHCTMCNKSFKRFQELRFHINKHTGAKPFKCPNCEKCFASSGNCYAHKARMHPSSKESSKKQKKNSESDGQLHFRPIAPKTNVNTNVSINNQYKYHCGLCSHSFNKKDNFTYHMYKHTGIKPFHCIHCPEKFVTRKGLYLHYEKCHPGKDRPLALLSKNAQLK